VYSWHLPDSLFRLVVLCVAIVVLAVPIRRWLGGRRASYAVLIAGLLLLAAGEMFRLLAALAPQWVAPYRTIAFQGPTHAAAYFLVLVGFLSFMRDLGRAQNGARRTIFRDRQLQDSLEKAKIDLERANAELEQLAATDALTGLLNRRQAHLLFDHILAAARRSSAPIGVILMDLDHFKTINDTYGHDAGDAALRHVAVLFQARLRASDIVARYGGEEFLFVLPETDAEGALCVAEDLRRRIHDQPLLWNGVPLCLSASFGVIVSEPHEDLDVKELCSFADEAMYEAKRLGGNRVAARPTALQHQGDSQFGRRCPPALWPAAGGPKGREQENRRE